MQINCFTTGMDGSLLVMLLKGAREVIKTKDMKITKCLHVTQTERKHLKAFLESGLTDAKINRKFYSIISGMPQGEKWLYKIRISTPRKNDFGKRVFDTQTIEILN
jgi:hypothetical protein